MSIAVFTFGRMNPPTVGHEKLADKVRAVARLSGGDPLIYLTHSNDKKKNPLPYIDKIKFAQKAFGNIVKHSSSNTIIKVLQELEKKYSDVVLVVGSDRVSDMRSLLEKYNGKDYSFESIEVVSAGERDPDAEGVEGMSASKMREFAAEGDMESFISGLPNLLQRDGKNVYDSIRKGMGVREDIEEINRHGIAKDATKAELEKIRSNPDSSPGAKKLAHWKLNMHHNEENNDDKPLNKVMKGDVKKSKVYVKDPKTGNVKKVEFGDPNMTIKKDQPERKASFRARHKCDQKKDKTSAGYWSCKAWEDWNIERNEGKPL